MDRFPPHFLPHPATDTRHQGLGNVYKSLREIKSAYGFMQASTLATQLKQLVALYNENHQRHTYICCSPGEILAQKVKHDSFSESLNHTIHHLEELLTDNWFSHQATQNSTATPTTPQRRNRRVESNQRLIYRQYVGRNHISSNRHSRQRKRQIEQRDESWQELIQETFLLDLYQLYLEGTGDDEGSSALALQFINDVIGHFCSAVVEEDAQLSPPFSPLDRYSFNHLVERYHELSD